MPFVSSYLIDIFVGLLVCIVYTLFLVQLVEKLGTYLATKRSGWARNRYIKIFIGAVRGEAAAFDTVVLASLILMLSLLMVLWIWSSATEVERDRRSLQNKFDVLTALRRNEKIEITQ